MRQVLITGGSGFLGKHLQNVLKKNNIEVTSLTSRLVDLTDCRSLEKMPKKNYDYIFHLAAWTQAGDFCAKRGGEQWIINQQINTNILHWWAENAKQAKLIALGTSVSYTVEENLVEERYMEGQPSDRFYAYAMSKRMLLAGLQSLHRQFGLNYLYVIPSTLYGPGYHMDDRQMHFIYDLIRKILRAKLYGEPVTLWGTGQQRRELVYIDDFIQTLLRLNEIAQNDYFNIGSGDDYSIKDFVSAICSIVDYDPEKINYDINQYVGAKSKILNIDKLQSIQSNPQKTNLHSGINNTINWFLENKEKLLSRET